jgi:hypothetical protein
MADSDYAVMLKEFTEAVQRVQASAATRRSNITYASVNSVSGLTMPRTSFG